LPSPVEVLVRMSMVIFWDLTRLWGPRPEGAEQQHGLRLSIKCASSALAWRSPFPVLEIAGLPDLAQGLRADIKHRVQAVGLA